MTAEIGNHRAQAAKFLAERTPIIAVERCGMEKDDRQP
jgi:hypothetical protein